MEGPKAAQMAGLPRFSCGQTAVAGPRWRSLHGPPFAHRRAAESRAGSSYSARSSGQAMSPKHDGRPSRRTTGRRW